MEQQARVTFIFAGLAIMGKYEADLAKIVAGQQEITNAEKLLDLSVTTFPEVLSIKNDMNGLRQIYDIYKAQQVGYACKTPVHNTHKCDHLKNFLFLYIYICLSCHLAGCKDTVVSDLVDRFRHPAATTGH